MTQAPPTIPAPAETEASHHPAKKRAKGPSMTQPMLTPLIDVFLFLIIFFLLSCQFHQAEGTITANLPDTVSGAVGTGEPLNSPIKLSILPDPSRIDAVLIEIESGPRYDNMQDLYKYLQQAATVHGDQAKKSQPIIIKPMPGIRWGAVVDVFNQAARAGFEQVGVARSSGGPA